MGKSEPARDVVVIGGSAGSIDGLLRLSAALPPDFPGSLFVAVHGGPHSRLADLMGKRSALLTRPAADRLKVEPGRVYVAPGDPRAARAGCSRGSRASPAGACP